MSPPRPFIREAGAGAGVVCLHSSASSSGQWRALMDALAPRHRVVAPDLLGSGRSPAWPDGRTPSLLDEVRFLEPAFAAAGATFHLVGHSYGGAVALRAALAQRERIRALVLIEPVLFSFLDPEEPAGREIAAVRDDTTAAVERGDLAAGAERFIDYWMGPGGWAATPGARRAAIATAMPSVVAQWRAIFGEPTPLAALARLDVETTLVVGSESPAASRAVAERVARTLPRVRRIVLEGAGHMAPITHPDRVHAAIAAGLPPLSPSAALRRG
jgi:pimeloyl-ACP methyl ester carboxylesterase